MSQPVSGYLYPRNLVLAKATTVVSGSADTTGVDVSQFTGNGITLIFEVSAVVGAGSLAVVPKGSDVVGSGYVATAGATITLSAVGLYTLFIPNFQGKFLNLGQTLSGTSVAYSAIVYGQPNDATVSSGYTILPQV